jgi:hypothetical protein
LDDFCGDAMQDSHASRAEWRKNIGIMPKKAGEFAPKPEARGGHLYGVV